MNQRTFPSKVDRWLRVAILVPLFVGVAAVVAVAVLKSPLLALGLLPLVLISVALPVWVLRGTYYTFADQELRVHCGPFEWCVPLSEIHSVKPTRNPLSSPALSLDRLRIEYGEKQAIMVSPGDKAEFLQEMQRRVPVV